MDAFGHALLVVGILAFFAIVGILTLFLGFRLLLPFGLLRRPRRLLAERLGPLSLLLCALWTIALVPAPFIFLWGWLIRLGQALLVDTPQQLPVIAPSLASSCTGSTTACLGTASGLAGVLWNTAISEPVRTMQVPPESATAALVFAASVTVVTIWRATARRVNFAGILESRTGAIVALALSFAAALYLCITSILAIPVFGEKVPDIAPFQSELESKLTALAPTDVKFPIVVELKEERTTFPSSLLAEPLPLAPVSAAPPQSTIVDTIWSAQIHAWDQMYSVLQERVGSFSKDAADFSKTTVSFFLVSDEGHVDAEATRRHETVLANSYGLWLADYRAAIEKCGESLRANLGQLRTVQTILTAFVRDTNVTQPDGFADQLRNALPKGYGEVCNVIRPVARDYLPSRSGPAETLGLFGLASAWLLKTESPELALIVGLLGFGFFGALATSFIREFRGTPGNELPSIGFIVPALIRGIGAAVLVFLLAKGGAAIFTKGDATPNAYAIFFACFVAAVFSDDVWLWARNRQVNELGGRSNEQQGGDASKAGHTSANASHASTN